MFALLKNAGILVVEDVLKKAEYACMLVLFLFVQVLLNPFAYLADFKVLKIVLSSRSSKDRKPLHFLSNIIGIFDLLMISRQTIFLSLEGVHLQWISHKKQL